MAIGLVRDLTAEAAQRAALGAGGKVVATYANGLTRGDLSAIAGILADTDIAMQNATGLNDELLTQQTHSRSIRR